MTNLEDNLSIPNDDVFIVPMALKQWVIESVKANQKLLRGLRRYPNPQKVNRDIVPTIQFQLAELSSINLAINKLTEGWISKESIEEFEI